MLSGDLYIAEKPSLAAAIAAVLPGKAVKSQTHISVGDITVTWLFGHMYELAMPEDYDETLKEWRRENLPIIPKQWRRKPRRDASKQITAIRSMLKTSQRIVHAGDPDAEGQLLVDELLEELGNRKPVFRVLVNEYTPVKVKEALRSIKPNSDPKFAGWSRWAYCRSLFDWMWGINLTREFTLKGREAGHRGVLSVGRVQTPTVALVVRRDLEIERFKPKPFYELHATIIKGSQKILARWVPKSGQAGIDDAGRLVDGAVASNLVARLRGKPARVVEYSAENKAQGAPLPFTLDTLQVAGDNGFGYSANKTLELAQSLYDPSLGLTSYPRSDSPYLSSAQHAEAPGRLAAIAKNVPALAGAVAKANPSLKSPAFNDEKSAKTSHHGIIPTDTVRDITALSADQRNIYELIVKNYVAQFFPAYTYQQTEVRFDIDGETFVVKGRVPLSPGWKEVFTEVLDDASEDDADDNVATPLPQFAKGEQLATDNVASTQKVTTPPKPFTEAALIKAMKNIAQYVSNPQAKARLKEGQGIGTSATRGPMIDELKKRELLVKKGKQIRSSPAARGLIAAVPGIAADAGFTGITEQTLDQVAAGAVPAEVFLSKMADLLRAVLKQSSESTIKIERAPAIACPECKQGELLQRKGANGLFWSCSRYRDGCKATFENKRGKPDITGKAKRVAGAKSATRKASATKKTATKRAPAKKGGV